MGYYKKIEKLFKKDFQCDDFYKRGSAMKFTCPKIKECKVNEETEPIWTSYIGDDNSNVMVVAEAPSKTGGTGAQIGGLTIDNMKDPGLRALFNFVKNYFNTIPYFTDLMKCGVAKQTKEYKKVFKIRKSNCVKHFLLKEIEILKPRVILCVGSESFNEIKNAREKGIIKNEIEVYKLLHYGRQANLPIKSDDKEKIIWPYQINRISKDKLTELDYFKQ